AQVTSLQVNNAGTLGMYGARPCAKDWTSSGFASPSVVVLNPFGKFSKSPGCWPRAPALLISRLVSWGIEG
ncbi:hypothetical protein, partial [Mycobacterium marinum]|uniref:hypothetical protein n=1 Tax=Mycobacterium marinum TaxID=1781 RepID=UPI0021C28F25